MHPMFGWWNARRRAAFGEMGGEFGGEAGVGCGPCGPQGAHEHGAWAGPHGRGGPFRGGPFGGPHGHGHGHGHGGHGPGDGDEFGGGSFGVRRPLRFLAFKLDLDEAQVTALAAILSDLKTERAQSAVDQRRTTSSLADAVAAETFDEGAAKAAADERVKSNERVQTAVVKALGRIHALLKPEQRTQLAYLLRTGGLSI
jgi:Spy/CpxP family protein refolding chaperone